jgi:hypothetical protein
MISDKVAPDIATLSTTMSPSATNFPEAISPPSPSPRTHPKEATALLLFFFFFFFLFLPLFLQN